MSGRVLFRGLAVCNEQPAAFHQSAGCSYCVLQSSAHTRTGTPGMSSKKDRTEYRIVCNGVGHMHRLHRHPKRDLAKARQAVIDANHHSDMHPDHFYGACAPWTIERRTVGAWKGDE